MDQSSGLTLHMKSQEELENNAVKDGTIILDLALMMGLGQIMKDGFYFYTRKLGVQVGLNFQKYYHLELITI